MIQVHNVFLKQRNARLIESRVGARLLAYANYTKHFDLMR